MTLKNEIREQKLFKKEGRIIVFIYIGLKVICFLFLSFSF